MKKTVVLGATPNPARFAYRASHMLTEYGHEIVPVGIKKGEVAGKDILNLREEPGVEGVDTVTLYIGPHNQAEWYDYIFSLSPKRIIFNPGTENFELIKKAEEKGIQTVEGCTLVMLRVGTY
ncbi:CoA-binding protein [Roseivirga sp. BDSF3-8]|uniref:CoA-binding protein n=1 Tax=Roseivirga sp. BDSF3-8 TaxID=3241598 RepID=UPI003531D1A9